MKKFDIQSIQLSMYPKKTYIHVSKYPSIHDIQVSTYPSIQLSKKKSVSKISKYPDIRKKWYPSIPKYMVPNWNWLKFHKIHGLGTNLRQNPLFQSFFCISWTVHLFMVNHRYINQCELQNSILKLKFIFSSSSQGPLQQIEKQFLSKKLVISAV